MTRSHDAYATRSRTRPGCGDETALPGRRPTTESHSPQGDAILTSARYTPRVQPWPPRDRHPDPLWSVTSPWSASPLSEPRAACARYAVPYGTARNTVGSRPAVPEAHAQGAFRCLGDMRDASQRCERVERRYRPACPPGPPPGYPGPAQGPSEALYQRAEPNSRLATQERTGPVLRRAGKCMIMRSCSALFDMTKRRMPHRSATSARPDVEAVVLLSPSRAAAPRAFFLIFAVTHGDTVPRRGTMSAQFPAG